MSQVSIEYREFPETQGRVHTSAATVAVLPEVEEVDIKIKDSDLRIDVFRAGGLVVNL